MPQFSVIDSCGEEKKRPKMVLNLNYSAEDFSFFFFFLESNQLSKNVQQKLATWAHNISPLTVKV